MEFNEWIKEAGGSLAAAKQLKVKERVIASWMSGDRAPSFRAAKNIVERTKGKVDYNGIYSSIAKSRQTRGKLC